MSQDVYLFLDESGNLDFSSSGTRFFVLTCVTMTRPFKINAQLEEYKYDCLEWGMGQEGFHCAEDNAHVRSKVFGIIAANLDEILVDSLIVEKSKTGPALRDDSRFYPEMLGYLLRYVLEKLPDQVDEVTIITDTIPLQRKRQAVEKAIKKTLSKMLPTGPRYRILHHGSRSHYGLQVADYCSWAIYRRWEAKDSRWFMLIRPAVRSQFDIFQTGTRHYY